MVLGKIKKIKIQQSYSFKLHKDLIFSTTQQHNTTTQLIDMLKFTFLSLIVWGLAIQITSAQGGTSCENALVSDQGFNIANNSEGDQWYTYVPDRDGKVLVSTCGQTDADTYVEVFDGCGYEPIAVSNDYCGKQAELTFQVKGGETYWICWRSYYTSQDYEWFMNESTSKAGEFCSDPIIVSEGANVGTIPTKFYRWYEFTATRNGKITVEAMSEVVGDCKVAIFNDCSYTGSLNTDDNWNPSKTAFEGVAGNSYLIAIYNEGSNETVNWSVIEGDWEAGERCENAISISSVEGMAIDHTSGTDKWYAYLALQDGDITISSVGVTSEDTYLEVYEGCNSEKVAFSDDANGLQSEIVINATAGNIYYIKWDDIFQPQQYAMSLKAGNLATDVSQLEENSTVGIYPNPSVDGQVQVDLTSFESDLVTVSVVSLTGATVQVAKLAGGQVVPHDLSQLSPGIYNIVMEDVQTRKVVKFLKK